jgi:hypothetical protein
MKIGAACVIFMRINDDCFTPDEKAMAIHLVLGMATHNGVTKDQILKVTKYLFDMCYEIETDETQKKVGEK